MKNDGVYTIYHLKGVKVGCTKNLAKRTRDYEKSLGKKTKLIVLETLPIDVGHEKAGDAEQRWTKKLGYPASVHYAKTMGTIAKRKAGFGGLWSITKEQRRKNNEKLLSEGKIGFQNLDVVKCPHCDTEGHLAIMQAWHFDRCKKNPNRKRADKKALQKMPVNQTLTCPHCGKEGQKTAMSRWHLDNCKHRT